jgi:hypothetical protein
MVLGDPVNRLRVAESTRAVGAALETILLHPNEGAWIQWWLVVSSATLLLGRANPDITWLAIAPLATAIAIFSLWQGPFGERYHFLVAAPAAAICLVAPLAWLRRYARAAAIVVIGATVAAVQPARARETWTAARLPEYGRLSAGVGRIVHADVAVCSVRAGFDVPRGMDTLYLFRMAGGVISPAADMSAIVQADGTVRFVKGC